MKKFKLIAAFLENKETKNVHIVLPIRESNYKRRVTANLSASTSQPRAIRGNRNAFAQLLLFCERVAIQGRSSL